MIYIFINKKTKFIHEVHTSSMLNAMKILNNFKVDITQLRYIKGGI